MSRLISKTIAALRRDNENAKANGWRADIGVDDVDLLLDAAAASQQETRFACRCGRFLADSAIRSADRRDDSRYYGIRTEVEWDCGRCGTVKGEEWEPQIVVTRVAKVAR